MKKKYWEMTTEELAKATANFDEPMVAEQSRPLTPAEKERWKKAKRKKGRPRVGQGFKRVSLSIEQSLLRRVSAVAKKRRLSRSQFFAQAVARELAGEGK